MAASEPAHYVREVPCSIPSDIGWSLPFQVHAKFGRDGNCEVDELMNKRVQEFRPG